MVKNICQKVYLGLLLLFLYAPILILIVLSFNASKSRTKWGGFTFSWYTDLFQDEAIISALYTTLIIAFTSALIAVVIGTATCIAMSSMKKTPKTILMAVTNIPMLNADIVTGISLMLIFVALNFTLGFTSVLLAHITFNIPYVILSVMPKMRQVPKNTYEAALDLGATPAYAFYKVVLPEIFPGILSGFLMAFTMSLDDFVITYFTKGNSINTLSTVLYSSIRKGVDPEMYALSTLMFCAVILLLVLINRRSDKNMNSMTAMKK